MHTRPQQADKKALLPQRPHRTGVPPVSYRTTLGLASLAAIFLWYWPVGRLALSPITFLNTFVHEYFHAILAWMTGGSVSRILVFNNGSGVTETSGGFPPLIASAGYVGSAIAGAVLLRLAHRERLARLLLMVGAALMVLGIAVLVRGEVLGVTIGLISAAVVFFAAKWLPGVWVVFLAQFVAVQQCAASFQAFYWLFVATSRSGVESDAYLMQKLTGVAAVFWAALWSVLGAALIYFAVRGAWREAGRADPRRRPPTHAEVL
jgi:hypothetical protein